MKRETKEKIEDLWDDVCFYPTEFFKNWIWPAYKIYRLMDRHDIVRLPGIKSTEWCDVTERMYLANMELVKNFMEKERPEEHILWYKDEEGNEVGHKYGECKSIGFPVLFPEYEGKYIMDIIKEIYHWYMIEEKEMNKDENYILNFWFNYLYGKHDSIYDEDTGCYKSELDESSIPTDLSFFEDKEVNWEILDKYLEGDRKNLVKKNFLNHKLHWLQNEIEIRRQKYLHLCVEVRQYLWT